MWRKYQGDYNAGLSVCKAQMSAKMRFVKIEEKERRGSIKNW